jgi:hypothetical protein
MDPERVRQIEERRRSELVALNWEDIEFAKEGLVIQIRRSKTDPEGQGRKIAIPYACRAELCPVRALETWRDQAGGDHGPVFLAVYRHGNVGRSKLSDRAVALAVQSAGRCCGLDAADFAGTASGRDSRPQQRPEVLRSGRSCVRPATAASPYAGTSARGRFLPRTPCAVPACRIAPPQLVMPFDAAQPTFQLHFDRVDNRAHTRGKRCGSRYFLLPRQKNRG